MHIVDFQDRKRTLKKKKERKDQLLDTISGEASREKAYCEAARVHDVYSQIQAIRQRGESHHLESHVQNPGDISCSGHHPHVLEQVGRAHATAYSCKASLVSTIAAAGAFEKFQEKSHR